ncbi:MAG: hypothetical protein COA57_05870 [Flavobacteriales bacterium]|nr:MAG: hypothetical protein COA57_05870 [Flavobacteriales bacterium]
MLLLGCSKEIDVELNYNPYDPDYTGEPSVVIEKIEKTTWFSYNNGQEYEKVKITANVKYENYETIELYRDGQKIGSDSWNNELTDYITAYWVLTDPAVAGNTYSYQVSLAKQDNETMLSSEYEFTVP